MFSEELRDAVGDGLDMLMELPYANKPKYSDSLLRAYVVALEDLRPQDISTGFSAWIKGGKPFFPLPADIRGCAVDANANAVSSIGYAPPGGWNAQAQAVEDKFYQQGVFDAGAAKWVLDGLAMLGRESAASNWGTRFARLQAEQA